VNYLASQDWAAQKQSTIERRSNNMKTKTHLAKEASTHNLTLRRSLDKLVMTNEMEHPMSMSSRHSGCGACG
jgi:hypothetical protein